MASGGLFSKLRQGSLLLGRIKNGLGFAEHYRWLINSERLPATSTKLVKSLAIDGRQEAIEQT